MKPYTAAPTRLCNTLFHEDGDAPAMLDFRADSARANPGQETRIGVQNTVLYPLFMDVTGRRCVVVGGGGVASRKARGLAESGARVTVISPEVTPEIEEMEMEVHLRP